MAVYCISYDLGGNDAFHKEHRDYNRIIRHIKKTYPFWHQSKSTWFIETNKTAKEVYDDLQSKIVKTDHIMIIQVMPHWWATGSTPKEYEWLKTRKF
jgi:hypothetical protein